MDLEADFVGIWRRTARGPQGHRHGSGTGDNQRCSPPCPPTPRTGYGGASLLGFAGVLHAAPRGRGAWANSPCPPPSPPGPGTGFGWPAPVGFGGVAPRLLELESCVRGV